MNPKFNLSFNKMLEQQSPNANNDEGQSFNAFDDSYSEVGHIRNLCFVLKNGSSIFLNYNYLVSGEFLAEENAISLIYSSHQIKLVGVNLFKLYYDIMQQIARQIVCTDERYNLVGEDEKPIVNEINIKTETG